MEIIQFYHTTLLPKNTFVEQDPIISPRLRAGRDSMKGLVIISISPHENQRYIFHIYPNSSCKLKLFITLILSFKANFVTRILSLKFFQLSVRFILYFSQSKTLRPYLASYRGKGGKWEAYTFVILKY